MAFKFEFKQTAGTEPTDKAKEAIKRALRGLSKELVELGVTITLEATVGVDG